MRILLDECVDHRLRNHLSEYDCESARFAGFGGLENGELLLAAEAAKFDVLLTVDRGFEYEQNLIGRQNRHPHSGNEINLARRLGCAYPQCTGRTAIHQTGASGPGWI